MSDTDEYESLFAADAAPAAAAPTDEYEQMFAADAAEETSRRRGTILRGVRSNPDQYARAKAIAPIIGAPPEVIERNLADVEPRARAREVEAAARGKPALEQSLAKPEFAKLAHDDLENASAIEQTLAVLKRSGRALAAGAYGRVGEGIAGVGQAVSEIVADSQRLQNPMLSLGLDQTLAPFFDWARRSSAATAEQIQGDISGAGTVERGIYSGMASLGQNLPAIAAGVATMNPGVGLAMMSAQTGGQEYGKARDAGKGAAESATYAANQAAWEYITEKIPMGWLVGDLEKGTGFLKMLGKQMLAEIPGEQVATLVQDLNEWATLHPELPFKAYLDQRGDAALQTAIATVVGTGGNVVVGKGVDALARRLQERDQGAQDAQGFADGIAKLNQYAEASKLRERDPQTFQEFVQAAGESGEVTDVWVDGRALANVLNQAGVEAAALPPAIVQQLPEALATGGDVRIPVGEYAARIAPEAYSAQLLEHLKASPEAMSVAEAKQFEGEASEQLKAEVEQALASDEAQSAEEHGATRVLEALNAELAKANRFNPDVSAAYATLLREFYVTMAQRAGATPEQMLQRYPLRVSNEAMEGAIEQAGAPPTQVDTDPFLAWYGDWRGTDSGATGGVQAGAVGSADAGPVRRSPGDSAPSPATFTGRSGPVDADGRPVTWFHGTRDNLSEFQLDHPNRKDFGWLGPGVYLTNTPGIADAYATLKRGNADPNVMPLYAAVRNPLRVTIEQKLALSKAGPEAAAQFTAEAKAAGHDGVLLEWPNGLQELVAFDPTQVKSAVGNRGTFDPASANILEQAAPSSFRRAATFTEARAAASAFQSKPLRNTETGMTATVSRNGLDKMLSTSAVHKSETSADHSAAVANLDALFSSAIYGWSKPDRDADPNVIAIHRLFNAMPGANGPLLVKLTVKELTGPDGSRIYAVEAVDAEKGSPASMLVAAYADADGITLTSTGHAGLSERVTERVEQLKRDDREAVSSERQNTLEQGPRAQIRFGDDITKGATIALLKDADLSSFLHETGHFFLEVIADLASQTGAPADVVADVQTLMDWFGVKDLATWRGMTLEQRRDKHEKFARGFEAYLFEGKAPNSELASLFSRFRAWLVNVYKSLNSLDVKLNDDVRGVFDRLIASEEQIRRAELERNYAPLFATAKAAGMTVEEFDAYQKLAESATRDALLELEGRSLGDMKWLSGAKSRALKKIQADVADKRKTVEKEVAEKIRLQPVYAAQRFIARGELDGFGDLKGKVEGGTKLSTAALKEMYGDAPAAPWRYLAPNLLSASDKALHPDQAAELLGFSSGDHLVRSILAAPPLQQAIDAETDTQMLWRYGDLSSPEAQERAAQAAVHNEARQRMVATELRALARANTVRGKSDKGASVNILARAAKQFAESIIARKRILDVKPAAFAAAETRAARAAQTAMAAGKTTEAAAEKRNQLINGYAYQAAEAAVEEFEKGLAYLRKFGRDGTRKAIDPEYVEQIDAMLEAVELRRASRKELESRKSLAEWIESQRAMGLEPTVDPDALARLGQRNVRQLTVEEFRGLLDAVRNVEHLGRLKKKLLTAKDKREFEEHVADAAGAIRENGGKAKPPQIEQTALDRAVQGARSLFTAHRKFASLMREFDGWKDGGTLWETFVRPANEAGDAEAVMRERANIDLEKVFAPLLKRGGLRKKVFVPEIGTSLSLEARLAIALNQGNETNRLRIMEGDAWSPAQVQAILDTLTKEDWDFVQSVWDYLDTFWPQIAAKEKRVSGIEPDRVTPTPVATPHGVYRGGYYPIAYDPNRSSEASAQQAATIMEDARRGLFARRSTQRGHTKARAESVKRPVRKDLGTIFQHVEQVVHDLAWHEYVIDANRLLRAKPIDSAIREHYGPEVIQELRSAVSDMAGGDIPAITALEKSFAWLRSGATIAGLGWNLTTAMLQPLGLTQSMVRVGPKWIGRGLAKFLGGAARMENVAKEVDAKSDFMRLRGKTMQREISEIRNKVAGREPIVQQSFFYLIQQMQRVVDIPTWLGAYEKAIAGGAEEARAVALADQAVIDSQSGGQIKDLAGVQRGGQFQKLWTNFYSYFSTTYNLLAESVKKTKGVADVPRLAADFLLLTTLPAALGVLIREALQGGDDDDELAKKLAQAQLSYLLGLMVGVREAGSAAQGFAGYSGPAGARFFSDFAKLITQVQQGEADEAALRAANRVGGVLFHYPSGQVERTAEGVQALAEGDTQNPAALLTGVK